MATPFHWFTPVRHLVARAEERHRRELVVGAFGFLHGQDIHIGALHPVDNTIHPRANGIHVPGRDAHALQTTAASARAST